MATGATQQLETIRKQNFETLCFNYAQDLAVSIDQHLRAAMQNCAQDKKRYTIADLTGSALDFDLFTPLQTHLLQAAATFRRQIGNPPIPSEDDASFLPDTAFCVLPHLIRDLMLEDILREALLKQASSSAFSRGIAKLGKGSLTVLGTLTIAVLDPNEDPDPCAVAEEAEEIIGQSRRNCDEIRFLISKLRNSRFSAKTIKQFLHACPEASITEKIRDRVFTILFTDSELKNAYHQLTAQDFRSA